MELSGKLGRLNNLIITCDDKKYADLCCWTKKGPNVYSAPDTWINRLACGMQPRYEELNITTEMHQSIWDLNGLMPFQIEDVKLMTYKRAIINGNQMGLGKTIEGIVAAKHASRGPILILCPKTVCFGWQEQWKKWAPEYLVEINPKSVWGFKGDVLILNYEKVRSTGILQSLQSRVWAVVIADEGHRLKNRKSKTAQSVSMIPSNRRWILTGTPILNKPDDLYHLLYWLHREIVGDSYWQFVSMFCIRDQWKQIVGYTKNTKMRAILDTILSQVYFKHTKKEVLSDLPDKLVSYISLEMDPKQKKLYNDIKQLTLEEYPNIEIFNSAVHFVRLQQVTSNPELLLEGCPNPKFDYVEDLAKDNPDNSFVVFTKFAETAKKLHEKLNRSKVRSVYHIGALTTDERVDQISKFVTKDAQVIILTIGSGGTGIDGFQHVSDTAVFIDSDWSPALNEQAEDRLHRIGQTRSVNIHYLQCRGTVDKYIGRKVGIKRADIQEILG